jgi:hypothetical protein
MLWQPLIGPATLHGASSLLSCFDFLNIRPYDEIHGCHWATQGIAYVFVYINYSYYPL